MDGQNMYHVQVGDIIKEYPEGTPYFKIAEDFQEGYANDIVLAYVNGKLQELHKALRADCTMSFETTAGNVGHMAYKRSMSLLLVKAIYDVEGHRNIDKVRIHFSVSK